ncbi:unnamed protein product [Didymodactylos carnosus]|uniref:WWE domain-containing protein n=1 Tax=Didymodactylos carnosus TaxID=1234261 RepID=A0A815QSE3_9BILA|nr:unnamed protein product [Didymodactylos carnosus]CAF1467161.1 unnamed protein product [Didymodactylos carnosus]CAF3525554.1 unnamed protein product [Didymodactylos carnosus]CAF4335936.1 unnamed protein product [Didymodactylos carnosus]
MPEASAPEIAISRNSSFEHIASEQITSQVVGTEEASTSRSIAAGPTAFEESAALDDVAPVLLRPRNFQWFWKSSVDSWSSKIKVEHQPETWEKYTAVENEIIEDALNEKQSEVELDDNYVVDLNRLVQCKKGEENRQRPIKRLQHEGNQLNFQLREERFALPITLATDSRDSSQAISTSSTNEKDDRLCELWEDGNLSGAYLRLLIADTGKSVLEVVEEAAAGIVTEGGKLGKEKETKWLAKQLHHMKHLGRNQRADIPKKNIANPLGNTFGNIFR